MIAARSMCGLSGSALLGLALLITSPALSATTNRPNKPAVATFPVGTSDLFLSVTGRGFGIAPPAASLEITILSTTGSTSLQTIASSDPAVQLWMDGQIVVKLPADNVRRLWVT